MSQLCWRKERLCLRRLSHVFCVRLASINRINKIPRNNIIIRNANRLMRFRILVERTQRRGWEPNHHQYRSQRGLDREYTPPVLLSYLGQFLTGF